jgi:uncharacterized membrane protein
MIGWIAACVFAGLMLPLIAMLYLDTLETKNEAKVALEKLEKLRREMEKEKRDANPDRPK